MKRKQPSPEEWAYLAGLFDGEGCISATQRSRSTFQVRLRVSQRSGLFLEVLVSEFDVGRITTYHRRDRGNRSVTLWNVVAKTEVRFLLQGMMPYLRLKKSQAELALELLDSSTSTDIGETVTQISVLKQVGKS